MFIRVDRGRTPPHKLDSFAAFLRDEVVLDLRKLRGYRASSVSIDRDKGMVSVVTYWDSPEDRERCDPVLAAVLKTAGRFELVPIEIEFYEQVFSDP